ncbi:MAG: two-component system response regulator [Gammaproteobacteria bacterium]|nr:two-component system response regulator [Gammaproteobacteria bacterium]RPG26409.1 MAG: DNA-binding response regulator [Gammaproteobacteria bacterium TMED50]|tara:strand:+ start:5127 stop:5804 length:678 start_codon:yes stop_codon:yes gene_type:complete
MSHVLIIEDSEDMAYGLKTNLEFEDYEVTVATDGEEGLHQALEGSPDLIILDLTLPKLDGLNVLSELRTKGVQTPLLILTARGEEQDKVTGLKLGADDYVTKPFALLELMARVEALLRRADSATASSLKTGDIEINAAARTVKRNGTDVELAPRELELLIALVKQNGQVVSRQELLQTVWGHAGRVETRTVDTHVAELRRKLEADPSNPRHIHTVRKVGYRFDLA